MTIFGITLSAAIVWLIAAAILAIIEAFTLGLTSIWFAGGAVAASITAILGGSIVIQVAVFLVVSIALVAITLPLRKKFNKKTEDTNIDAIIGQEGIVEKAVSHYQSGQVRADGKVWSATCTQGEIKKGAVVIIKAVKGVTLTVEEKREQEQED
ncbi:MAG: NfeD family protein [Bacillota bacterium]|nr:NfeD family protein [Bacillota bacterium]